MRTYKLLILQPAKSALDEIARVHRELVGPASAWDIMEKIRTTLERLKTFPLSGTPPGDRQLREAGYRFVIAGKYICVYRLIENMVYVYHIVHGATDYPQLLKDIPDIQK